MSIIDKFKNIHSSNICLFRVKGGLGNQLFQIAAGINYALKYDIRVVFVSNNDGNNRRSFYWNSLFIHLPHTFDVIMNNQYNEKGFHYEEIPFINDNMYIEGYFQSSKFFKEIDNSIHEIIKLPYYKTLSQSNIVIVHARRGDYTTEKNIAIHGPLTPEYYIEAVKIMKTRVENPIFILVSDDNSFWKTSGIFSKDDKYIVFEETDEIVTFSSIIAAKNFIIANSSFSWWAVKLSGSKNVISPKNWFGPDGPKDTQDIYEDGWTII